MIDRPEKSPRGRAQILTNKWRYKMKVNNMYEFMRERGFNEESVEDVERTVYKYTSCGAWFSFEGRSNGGWDHWGEVQLIDDPLYNSEGKVTVGSIVEGVDYGTEEHTLQFPFTLEEFDQALDEVEKEVEYIWNETHGCDDCFLNIGFTDSVRAINPDCKTCKGKGIII